MLRTYRTELRRSPVLVALPALVVIDLLVLFGRARYWIGVWPEASAASQEVTLFLGPALAGLAAWQAGRASRAEMPEALSVAARPAWQAEAVRLGATLTLGFTAYAVGCLVAAGVSIREGGPGFLWPSYLLTGMATLTIFAAVGHMVGRWWPSAAFTPAACALGSFICMAGLGQSLDMFVLSGTPDQMLRTGPVLWHLAFAAALTLLAVVVPVKFSRGLSHWPLSAARYLAVLATAAATVVALLGIPAAGGIQGERSAASVRPLCKSVANGSSRVCVWPEHRKYLPELARMADNLSRIPQAWVREPNVFAEYGLLRTKWGDRGFDVAEGHVRTAAVAMSSNVFDASFPKCRPPVENRDAWQSALERIELWLEYRAMRVDPKAADEGLTITGAADAPKEAAAAVRKSESEQKRWVEQQFDIVGKNGCGP
ncbi:ABC transporter permease [Streptomyces sp. NPDC021080]|uniref:DUF7224 domain-containing protein n=1 Tax=Streptomyces sp. NPDC021080 TaxID=3365110 RepID=UPI0037A662EB